MTYSATLTLPLCASTAAQPQSSDSRGRGGTTRLFRLPLSSRHWTLSDTVGVEKRTGRWDGVGGMRAEGLVEEEPRGGGAASSRLSALFLRPCVGTLSAPHLRLSSLTVPTAVSSSLRVLDKWSRQLLNAGGCDQWSSAVRSDDDAQSAPYSCFPCDTNTSFCVRVGVGE